MSLNLSQNQRIFVAGCYLVFLFALFKMIGGNFSKLIWDANNDSSIWFYSGAFMIILGAYVVEPFFTKPSDVIANSTAILIALFGLSAKQNLQGYSFIFYYAVMILILSLVTITLKDSKSIFWQKLSRSFYWLVENFGAAKVIFSIVYLSAAYSYFTDPDKLKSFIYIVAFWICLTFFDVIGLVVERVSRLTNYLTNKIGNELGQAIGCENPLLYKVEIDYTKHRAGSVKYGDLAVIETAINIGSIGMIVDIKYLLNKRWLTIYLLQDCSGEILRVDLKKKKLVTESKSIFSRLNATYLFDVISCRDDIEMRTQIEGSQLYKEREQFIGCVSSGSNINTINFSIVREGDKLKQKINEGTILKTSIYGQETLYQVINGNAKEEHLENFDKHGFIVGIARKLGKYDEVEKDLDVSKWMPSAFSPLFFAFSGEVSETRIKEMAKSSIGRLPNTDLEIIVKDFDATVTHNTAILGILGIGKSCLSFELIKKISEKNIKIICLDITNQYYSKEGLFEYVVKDKISFDLKDSEKVKLKQSKDDPKKCVECNPQNSGNKKEYEEILDIDLKRFLEDSTSIIKVYNPDLHPVSKGVAFKNTSLDDLTVAEKTRIISERLFIYAMNQGPSTVAKYLLVFEEAHSLVPEWNSVSSEGDKSATNGTAKVILQGRKFGLGSLVITQRTANVSKSILNQCNTVFALRIFDDTGKNFLENYIGRDYTDTLPTLEERHAIAIGKGLRLKQPVIIQLNDRKHIINPPIAGAETER